MGLRFVDGIDPRRPFLAFIRPFRALKSFELIVIVNPHPGAARLVDAETVEHRRIHQI
jgi:hypothetical protein